MTNGLTQGTWQDAACDDVLFVLRFLKQRHGMDVWKVSADPQGQWARLYLRGNLSPRVMTELRDQCANSPQIHFGPDWLICDRHNVSIYPAHAWREMNPWHKPPWLEVTTQLFMLLGALLLVAGGTFVLVRGIEQGVWKDIGVGILSVLLFGFSVYSTLQDLAALVRRARRRS